MTFLWFWRIKVCRSAQSFSWFKSFSVGILSRFLIGSGGKWLFLFVPVRTVWGGETLLWSLSSTSWTNRSRSCDWTLRRLKTSRNLTADRVLVIRLSSFNSLDRRAFWESSRRRRLAETSQIKWAGKKTFQMKTLKFK